MLSKRNRLTKHGSFTFVYNKGERKRDGYITLVYVKSKSLRLGFSVSNKLGKAVIRNKLKRRLRAITRKMLDRVKPVQAVIIAKPGAEKLDFLTLEKSMQAVLTNSGLLN